MKRIVLMLMLVALIVAGCDLFYDEFTLSLNMDPVRYTRDIPAGGSSYVLLPTDYNLGDYVDDEYAGDITGGGIYNIGVMLSPTHAARTIDGKAVISYGAYSATVSYVGTWNEFSSEVTLLGNPNLVSIDDPLAFNAMVREIFRQSPLPVVTIEGDGATSQPITVGDQITISIYGQAAASINLK